MASASHSKHQPRKSAATLIPPAFGLAGVNLHTWTGWGSVTHWNAFVANLEMHGKGTFYDPRLNDPAQFPVASRAGFGNVLSNPDLITSVLQTRPHRAGKKRPCEISAVALGMNAG